MSIKKVNFEIAIYDDIVEIISVGGFVNGLTIDEISNGRSELRNRVVANLFKELHFIESWGSGIGKVKDSCNKRGVKFELAEKGLFVEAVFYRPNIPKVSDSIRKPSDSTEYDRIVPNKKETVVKPLDTVGKVSDNLTRQEEKIIQYIDKHQRVVSKEVEKLLSIKESRTRELLKNMMDRGLIERLGRGRSSYYQLLTTKK